MNRTQVAFAGIVVAFALSLARTSAAQVKEPGAHPKYMFGIDPHLILQYGDRPAGAAGFGVGARAMIPFVHNGPVPQINNDIGISFGIDFTYFGKDDVCRRRGVNFYAEDCNAQNLWFPAAAEWNFYLTRVVSVFVDLGLGLQYERFSFEGLCNNSPCSETESNVDVEFMSWIGGRFRIFGDRAGLVARVGWPYFAAGGFIQF